MMVLAMIAALAAAPQQDTPQTPTPLEGVVVKSAPTVAAPVVVGDDHDWSYRPPQAKILSVWPEAAYRARISGKATLSCLVDIHGLAEDCKVASETPRGRGFGQAALLLRTTFKLKPAQGPDGPRPSLMSITVGFNAEDNDQIEFHLGGGIPGGDSSGQQTSMNGTAPEMRAVVMLDHPVWAQAATFAQVERAYPAKGGGVEGYAVAHCQVDRFGDLSRCEARLELPEDHGFGNAAVSLTHHFRARLDGTPPPRNAPLWVDLPVRFTAPGPTPDRSLASPTWLAGFDPLKAPKLFPPEAASKGLTTGRGVARCVVAPDGALTDCAPMPADPDGVGFSEAAVKLAAMMKMNPWTGDGRPVDGAVINIPIRLNLASRK